LALCTAVQLVYSLLSPSAAVLVPLVASSLSHFIAASGFPSPRDAQEKETSGIPDNIISKSSKPIIITIREYCLHQDSIA